MSNLVLGVGPGVFIVIALWICALSSVVIFARIKRPSSFLGIGSIGVASIITIVLFLIPRGHQASGFNQGPLDYLFVWRSALIIFLLISFIVAIVLYAAEYLLVPMSSRALRKVVHKTHLS